MNKERVYDEWMEATQEAIVALSIWSAELADWKRNGGEHEPGAFDSAFSKLCAAGLDSWAGDCQAGCGIDVLATIVQGGDICPDCRGTGTVRSQCLPEYCPTCGGIGAIWSRRAGLGYIEE